MMLKKKGINFKDRTGVSAIRQNTGVSDYAIANPTYRC